MIPLVIATGADPEMRPALGTAAFFGMLSATLFGLLFTPVFYVLVRWIGTTRLFKAPHSASVPLTQKETSAS